MKDKVLTHDINHLVEKHKDLLEKFRGRTILVTGATGLIGSQLVHVFMVANREYDLQLRLYALVRNEIKAQNMFSREDKDQVLQIITQDIRDELNLPNRVDVIFHCAGVTDSWSFVHKPVETIQGTVAGCDKILALAKRDAASSIVFLSTMEIYGQSEKLAIKEDDYGYLDPIKVRSSYPEAKRLCECLCRSYYEEFNVPVKIARLTQTFGPGVDMHDQRVFAQFARAVIEQKDIVLHTQGRTVRNYCYTRDVIAALLLLADQGVNGEAYNIANEEAEISIYDMADMLVKPYHGKVIIEMETEGKHGYNPESRTCIKSEKIRQLGWIPEVGLREMYANMCQSMMQSEQ